MAKETEKPEETPKNPSLTPMEDAWMRGMEDTYPDLKGNREALFETSKRTYDEQHTALKKANDFISRANKEADDMKAILDTDPDLSTVFTSIFEKGTRPVIAFIKGMRPLLKDYAEGKLTDEEVETALKEEEAARLASSKKGKMQIDALEAECAERGLDVKETLDKFESVFMRECNTPEECRDQVKQFFKILDFDDAVSAAETRGRNSKITEEKRSHAPGVAAAAPSAPAKPAANRVGSMTAAADAAAVKRRVFEA